MDFTLRAAQDSDAQSIAALLGDARVSANLRDLPQPYTPQDALDFFAYTRQKAGMFYWVIDVAGEAVGALSIALQDNVHSRTAELGYCLLPSHWGQGVMTAAVRQACAEVFAATDALRIFAEPYAGNAPSARVLEKAGFTLEGTLRQAAVKNGAVLDMRMYAKLRGEPR